MQEEPPDDVSAFGELDAALTAAQIEARFGDRVRNARRESELTQRQLADAVGLDASAISRLEQGLRAVRLGEAAAIAVALKLPLSELLVLSDDPLIELYSACTELENATSRLRDAEKLAVDSIDHVQSVLIRPDVRDAIAGQFSRVNVDDVIALCASASRVFADYDPTYLMRRISLEIIETDQPHLILPESGPDESAT